jgi:copper ion binding protein
MHCPSCVESITALVADIPGVVHLGVSLLLHRVTFLVDTSVSSSKNATTVERVVEQVKRVLTTEGGFFVTDEHETSASAPKHQSASIPKPKPVAQWFSRRRENKETKVADERRRRHLERCEACRLEQEAIDRGLAPPTLPTPAPPDQVLVTTLSIEGMTCASCTSSISAALKAYPAVLHAEISLLSSSGTIKHKASFAPAELVAAVDDAGFEAEVIESHPAPAEASEGMVKTTLSIYGMTCASCSSAIDRALRQISGVEEVSIDVLGNSGTVTHAPALAAAVIKETIEDVGYDAEIVGSVPLDAKAAKSGPELRTVSIRVDGTFCNNCITQLNEHLATMPLRAFTPLTLHAPVTTVTYAPQAPLTVRDILASLAGVAPEFDAEVLKVQSLSERSQAIQKREVKVLAAHLAVAVLVAIPSFIIAIVSMVLLKHHHPFRVYWDTPIWGGANRGTIALWILATVVQFGVGW